MKQLWTLLLLFFPAVLLAQPEGWTQEYFKEGSHYVISRQKNKVGLYSRAKGVFTIEPHKGYIIHLEEPGLLLDVNPKDEKVDVYHYYDKVVQQLETKYDTGNFWFGHILGSQWNEKLKATPFEQEYNGEMFEGTYIGVTDEEVVNDLYPDYVSKLNYYFEDRHLRLEFFYENHGGDPIPMKSQVFPEEDSIDFEGNFVYEPMDSKFIQNSGYFNLKTGEWDIPPVYMGTNSWENLIGCYYSPRLKNEEKIMDKGMVYAFYRKDGKDIVPTKYQQYQGFTFPLDLWPFEDDKVWYDYDSIYVYHKNKKGTGLYKIPLKGKDTLNGYSLQHYPDGGWFEVQQIFEPEYEYILRSGDISYSTSPYTNSWEYILAAKGDKEFDIYSSYRDTDTTFKNIVIDSTIELKVADVWINSTTSNKEKVLLIDQDTIFRVAPKDSSEMISYEIQNFDPSTYSRIVELKTEVLSNGQLVVNSHIGENDEFPIVMHTKDGLMDSIDIDGNVVYHPPLPGNYHSGVFDAKSQKWIIPPFNSKVLYANSGYTVERQILDENQNIVSYEYDFMNPDGSYEFQGWDEQELFDFDENKKYLIPGKKVNLWNYINNDNYSPVYFERGSEAGIALIDYTFNSRILTESSSFVKFSSYHFASMHSDMNKIKIIGHNIAPLSYSDPIAYISLDSGKTYDFNIPHKTGGSLSDNLSEQKYLNAVFEIKESDETGNFVYSCIQYGIDENELQLEFIWDTTSTSEPINISFSEVVTDENKMVEFKIKVLNDKWLYIKDNRREGEGVPIIDPDWGTQFDEDGNVLYTTADPGYYNSGVYDYQNKKWYIKPNYTAILWMIDSAFILNEPVLNKENLRIGRIYYLKKGEKMMELGRTEFNSENQVSNNLSCGKINDSLLYVINYTPEIVGLPLMDSQGLDSIDNRGNFVYSDARAGVYKSGVYNVKSNKWIVPQKSENIYTEFEDVFIVRTPKMDESNKVKEFVYSIYDLSGKIIQKDVPLELLDEKYRYLLE